MNIKLKIVDDINISNSGLLYIVVNESNLYMADKIKISDDWYKRHFEILKLLMGNEITN